MTESALRILVTGGNGQLAQCLRKTEPAGLSVTYANRDVLNPEHEAATTEFLQKNHADFVINAAAYTRVDQAEKEPEAAFAANELAVKNLARVCKETGSILIHISTDFLFHGGFNRPIDELQKPAPVGVYARSKYAGETAFLDIAPQGAIVRTSWLYSEFGANFMKTMLRLGSEKPRLTVISDQHGSPTYAADLAAALWKMISHMQVSGVAEKPSIYHFSNYGVTTWYDFATAILEIAGIDTPVEPILTEEYPVPTPRPAYSALWPRKFSREFEFPVRHWHAALVAAISALKKAEGAKK